MQYKTRVYNLLQDRGIPYLAEEKNVLVDRVYDSPMEIVKLMRSDYFALDKQAEECCYVLAFDNARKCNGLFLVSRGTVNISLLSPREVFIRLCLAGAVSFVLIHNHPSGSLNPSEPDMQVARQLEEAGKIMGIGFLDSIILGREGNYYSFKEEGKLGG